MKLLLHKLSRFRDVVIPFASWEMLLMRFLCSLLFFDALPDGIEFSTMPYPTGFGQWIDVTFLAAPGVWDTLKWLTIPFLIAYTLGRFTLPALAYLTLLLIAYGTLRNSQGAIGHNTQLVALVLLAQWVMCLWESIRGARNNGRWSWTDDLSRQRLIIHAARVMIAAAYLTTAISKIDRSNGHWLWDTPNLSVQIIKTQSNDYYNTLEYVSPVLLETLPNAMAEHPFLTRVLFSPGLLLELFFFLALLGRGWSAVLGIATIILHQLISRLMSLDFPNHEILLWIFFVNVPYWVYLGITKITRMGKTIPAKTESPVTT